MRFQSGYTPPPMFPTVPPPPRRLLVFARIPEPGNVMPRLAATLGEERAPAAYETMLRDTIAALGPSTPDLEIEFLWEPAAAANGAALRAAFAHHAVAMQTGATLGDRLCMAFSERFFFHHTQMAIAIGVGAPPVDRATIERAFLLLDSCEYVVGPTAGRGYWLIGCRGPSFEPIVFDAIDWGTPSVLPSTLSRIASTERTVAILPERSGGGIES